MATGEWERFVRSYTGGVGTRDLQRLFDRDAAQAYGVVTREHEGGEPAGDIGRLLHRARILFLGLFFKLSPPRRVLFGLCILTTPADVLNRPVHSGYPEDPARGRRPIQTRHRGAETPIADPGR